MIPIGQGRDLKTSEAISFLAFVDYFRALINFFSLRAFGPAQPMRILNRNYPWLSIDSPLGAI